MKTVCIESPLSGDYERNVRYARACLHHALQHGVAPFVSHLIYAQVLDDRDAPERAMGMEASLALGDQCDERWVYDDLGVSGGMKAAIERAAEREQPVRYVAMGRGWELDGDGWATRRSLDLERVPLE